MKRLTVVTLLGLVSAIAFAQDPAPAEPDEASAIPPEYLLEPTEAPAPSPLAATAQRETFIAPGVPAVGVPVPPEATLHHLSSGAPVWVLERHEVPLVRIEASVCWQGSTADEHTQLVSSYVDLMLGSATTERSGTELETELDRLGAVWGVGLGTSRVWADVEVPTGMEAEALPLVAESLLQAKFKRRDAKHQRNTWAIWFDQLELDLYRTHRRGMNHAWFPEGHPSRHGNLVSDIWSLERQEAEDLLAEILDTGAPFFIVVGDTTAEAVLPLIEAEYGHLDGTKWPATLPDPQPTSGIHVVHRTGFDVGVIEVAVKGPGHGDARVPAASVLMGLLASDFTSRLNHDLRETRGITYGVGGDVEAWLGTGRLTVNVETQEGDLGEAMGALTQQLNDLAAGDTITQEEVERARSSLLVNRGRDWETTQSAALILGILALRQQTPQALADQLVALSKVTVDQVEALAQELWAPSERVWVLTGDVAVIEKQLREAELTIDTRIQAGHLAEQR
jgi:zinc protease